MNAPSYLVYAQRFDIIPQLSALPLARAAIPDPITGLYLLKRVLRTDQSRMGGIIPLSHCRMPVQLVPPLRCEGRYWAYMYHEYGA
jgi:hypothetical protein